jgi:hypothetical protein
MVYDVGYSLSSLPDPTAEHSVFYSEINQFLQNLSVVKRKLYSDLNPASNTLISRLTVYVADGNIVKTTESPDYELSQLVTDIGGQLVLWIVITFITLGEVVQLAGAVLRKLTRSEIRHFQPGNDDDDATGRGNHGSQRVKNHDAAKLSDDVVHARQQTENGSASSLPVDEVASSV